MIRTQIQLSPEQMGRLKQVAARQGRSVAEVVREGVEVVLQRHSSPAGGVRERAAAVSGRFRSGVSDMARRHDQYLAEALDQ